MRYAADDVLRLAPRLARVFPVPGAADLYVCDVVYRREARGFRYLATIQYTRGVIGAKRRMRQVVTFTESHDANPIDAPASLELAPDNLPLLRQYEQLLQTHASD